MGWTFEAGMAPEQVLRVQGMDLQGHGGAATGAKTGETVAMADLSARQRHDMWPNRAASGPLTHV